MLGDLLHGVSSATTISLVVIGVVIVATSTFSNLPDHSIWRIFRNYIWWVNHVELFGCILACEGQDGQLASWVIREEVGHIQHLPRNHDPTIALGGVLGHLLQGISTTTTAFLLLRRLTCWSSGLVHAVLVRAARELRTLDCSRQPAAGQCDERGFLHSGAEHVLCTMLASDASEHHAIQQRVATEAIVAMH